jgi:uncharacterized PurR-regulated membrane protein YhhQ (DUF165 family)
MRGVTGARLRTINATGVVLIAAYIASIVSANIATDRIPGLAVLELAVPAGSIIAGLTFTLRDLLHDHFGGRFVLGAVALGAGLSWCLATPTLAAASASAFMLSEIVDSCIYAELRARSRLRAVVYSNLAGLLIDSAIFVPLAFGTVAALPGPLAGKALATMLAAAALVSISWMKRREAP